eukprot:TRINITY_DN15269_c0_g1_i1.p2 TRINITY_DN15269_c0_g1~~TRINITY_DN15269_c0_g1_i1.p2  ORF type:complete len:152 (-),score=45.34 TRINITY_DN15269_c0_g1_i1:245-700(-)
MVSCIFVAADILAASGTFECLAVFAVLFCFGLARVHRSRKEAEEKIAHKLQPVSDHSAVRSAVEDGADAAEAASQLESSCMDDWYQLSACLAGALRGCQEDISEEDSAADSAFLQKVAAAAAPLGQMTTWQLLESYGSLGAGSGAWVGMCM